MESFESKNYRDKLAEEIKEVRKTDPTKAVEILNEARQTEEYQEARKKKIEDHKTSTKDVYVETGLLMKEKKETLKNLIEKFEKLYYVRSLVTSPSKFARSEENPEGRERPFFVRARRAELYKKIKGFMRNGRENVIEEARIRDNIAEQYLNQREVNVHFPEYGDIGARMTDIVPPESLVSPEKKNLPPIVLLPGIANDIEVVNNLATEIAMQGRRVIVIAQPESINGHVTEKFAEAVEKADTFEPHTVFFTEVIKHVLKDNEAFEIWGFSTGGAIVAMLLKNPEFQKKVKNAVLLSPAGFVKQSKTSLNLGLVQDIGFLKKKSAYGGWGYGFEKNEQLRLHDKIITSLIQKITEANENWRDAHVSEGGTIVVVNGEKDMVTKSINGSEQYKENPQVKVLNLPNAYHMTPLLDADNTVPKIFKEQL